MTNPMNDETAKPIAFCQNCGKPLTVETVRKVGPAVYCEPCLEARLGAAGPIPGAAGPIPGAAAPGYGPVNAGYPAGQPFVTPNIPNPGLAALLGLIPGVGAMYNEQYAKGIVHLVIFAVLVMFSHSSGIFDLFVIGWIAYMSIEAHHTAKARRDGTPLPNPFGLNDVGERMGFGRNWPGHQDVASAAAAAARAATEAARDAAATVGFQRPPIVTPPPATPEPSWGAPADTYPDQPHTPYPPQPEPPAYASTESQTYAPPYTQSYAQSYAQTYAQPYTQPAHTPPPYVPVTPYVPSAFPPGLDPSLLPTPPRTRFPAGAVLLISLGLVFLLGTLGLFSSVPGSALVGVTLIILGVWVFLRRMMDSGDLAYDGTSAYHLRLLRASRGPIWLVALGILALLASFHLGDFRSAIAWVVILAGVMMLLQRALYNAAAHSAAAAYPYPPTAPGAPAQTVPPSEVASSPTDTPKGAL